jgi:hypothetical protein
MRERRADLDHEVQSSVAFDGAADFYDETKALSPDALAPRSTRPPRVR